ncbi:MAG: phage holin family protein [Actinobacteria bacterium]|nr:phage holin family protein [Actinomycetota bacterium]
MTERQVTTPIAPPPPIDRQERPVEPNPPGHASPPAVAPAVGDPRSTSEIIKDVVGEVQTLFRAEIELAKHEITAGITARVQALVFAVVGAVFGLFALGFLGVTVAVALANVLPAWAAWLIVFGVYLLIAGIALFAAMKKATSTPMAPEQTKRSIEETKTWATTQLRR